MINRKSNSQDEIVNKLKNKHEAWCDEYIMADCSPWSYNYLTQDGHMTFWLTSNNEKFIKSGYYTKDMLERWVNEDNTVLVEGKTFVEFKDYCELNSLTTWRNSTIVSNAQGKTKDVFSKKALANLADLTKVDNKKFNKHFINELDGNVKGMIQNFFSTYSAVDLMNNKFTVSLSDFNSIAYYLKGLSSLGIGRWQMQDFPATRENFAFYLNFILKETQREIYSNRRIRKYKKFIVDATAVDPCTFYIDIFYKNKFIRSLEYSSITPGEIIIDALLVEIKTFLLSGNVFKILKKLRLTK